jgi:hypothetical protein
MPIYHVSLGLTRPRNWTDAELEELFREAIDGAIGVAIELGPAGMVIEADAGSLELLEVALRTKLEARGGSLERMTATQI